MRWKPRAPKWNWKAYLTKEEAVVIRRADRAQARLKREARRWSARRLPIQNRAIQRAKYAAGVR